MSNNSEQKYNWIQFEGTAYAYDLPYTMTWEELKDYLLSDWLHNESELDKVSYW